MEIFLYHSVVNCKGLPPIKVKSKAGSEYLLRLDPDPNKGHEPDPDLVNARRQARGQLRPRLAVTSKENYLLFNLGGGTGGGGLCGKRGGA